MIFIFRPIIDLGWNIYLVNEINIAAITGLIIDALLIIYVVIKNKIYMDSVLRTGLLLFVYMLLITIINGSSISDFGVVLRYLSALSFYIVVVPNLNDSSLDKIVKAFLIITIIPITLTYMQKFGIIKYTYWDYADNQYIYRGSGGYFQPSVLTRFCCFGFLYALYFLEKNKTNKGIKSVLYMYIAYNIGAVLLSYHRTGYLLIMLNLIVWLYLKNKKNILKNVKNIFFGLTFFLLIFICLYRMNIVNIKISTFKSLISTENIIKSENGNTTLVLRGRGQLLKKLFEGFEKNPVSNTIFGNGVVRNKITGIEMKVADMDVIRIIWNYGFVGLFIWIIHILCIVHSMKVYKRDKKNILYRLSICIILNYIIWGFTCEVIGTPNIMYHLYAICGYAYFKKINEKKKEMII